MNPKNLIKLTDFLQLLYNATRLFRSEIKYTKTKITNTRSNLVIQGFK